MLIFFLFFFFLLFFFCCALDLFWILGFFFLLFLSISCLPDERMNERIPFPSYRTCIYRIIRYFIFTLYYDEEQPQYGNYFGRTCLQQFYKIDPPTIISSHIIIPPRRVFILLVTQVNSNTIKGKKNYSSWSWGF